MREGRSTFRVVVWEKSAESIVDGEKDQHMVWYGMVYIYFSEAVQSNK